jgi:hypothetical protein
VAADLEQLAALREYLIFGKKAGAPAQDLIDAIDDYAEKAIGARCTHRVTVLEDCVEAYERTALRRPGQGRAPHRRDRQPSRAGGRIHIEKINGPFLFRDKGTPAEYGDGLKRAIDRGWLKLHESGTFVTFTPAGADLFA